eukprot:TRINITY_DN3629_c0_g1_i5.p1 TRINITY_DN3629_c0_g1~~TRINITY_DN3629_c0_g1_i5.p1  ORF type:complete len:824 (-),score=286.53 TRINITY_DN3629_c0_g1_i5:53-2473(-)
MEDLLTGDVHNSTMQIEETSVQTASVLQVETSVVQATATSVAVATATSDSLQFAQPATATVATETPAATDAPVATSATAVATAQPAATTAATATQPAAGSESVGRTLQDIANLIVKPVVAPGQVDDGEDVSLAYLKAAVARSRKQKKGDSSSNSSDDSDEDSSDSSDDSDDDSSDSDDSDDSSADNSSAEDTSAEDSSDSDKNKPVPTKKEMFDRTQTVMRHNQQFINEVRKTESGKQLAEDAKNLIKIIKEQEETRLLLEKGKELVKHWKDSEQAKQLRSEGEEFLGKIQGKEEFAQFFAEGKTFVAALKDQDSVIEPDQVERLLKQGVKLADTVGEDKQCKSLLSLAQNVLKEVKAQEKNKSLWKQRKEMLEQYLRDADPQMAAALKPFMDEGGKLIEDLKAADTVKLMKEGKKIVAALLKERAAKLGEDGDVNVNMGDLVDDGKKWMTSLLDELDEKDGKSEKLDKLVLRVSEATDDKEAQALIQRSHKLLTDVAASEHGHNLLHQGKQVAQQLSERGEIRTLLTHTKQLLQDATARDQFAALVAENREFLVEVKRAAVPFITEQVVAIKVPPISGTKSSSLGEVHYELRDIVFAGIELQPENADIAFDTASKTVALSVKQLCAHIKSFTWSYSKNSFPRLKDNGTASANVTNATCNVSFSFDFDEKGKPSVNVTNFLFTIGTLTVKTGDCRASGIYNWVLGLFSTRIKEAVQNQINTTVVKTATKLTTKLNALVKLYFPGLKAFAKDEDAAASAIPVPAIEAPTATSEVVVATGAVASNNNVTKQQHHVPSKAPPPPPPTKT